ncbi:MATE family efflux transporter [Bacteroidia bacterium]|nr:MATE family efflux transporter [Bacteroidia bacterium]
MKNNRHSETLSLGTASINSLLWKFSVPAIIAMVAASVYNITDSIFIGHGVGPMALSGLAITFPIMNLAAAFGTLFGVGAASVLSILLGKKAYRSANYVLGNLVTLNIITGVGLTLIMLPFLKPILIFFGASDQTLPYAYEFMFIILLGNVITHIFFGLNALLRSLGHPKYAMTAILITVGINVILNPLFIFGFKLGIKGSAYATLISQFTVLMWEIWRFSDKKQFVHWQKGIFKLKRKIVGECTRIGLAPFLINAASCVIVILINKKLYQYGGGDEAVGAYGIVNRVSMLFVMICFGICQGMQPIVGYNYGAKQYERAVSAFKKAVIFAAIVMSGGFVICEFFPQWIVAMFTTDEQITKITIDGLRWVLAMFPLVSFQIVASYFFQSIGHASKAIILSVSRQVFLLIPFLLIFPFFWGYIGVFASIAVSDFLSVIIAAILIYIEIKNINKWNSDKLIS